MSETKDARRLLGVRVSDELPFDEEGLVLRLLDRDDTALVDMQRAYGPYLLAMLARYFPTLRPEDRDEVYCDAIRKAWDRIETYDDRKASLATWLVAIARNACIDYLRSRGSGGREEEVTRDDVFWELQAAPPDVDAPPAVPVDPRVAVIETVLGELSSVQRGILEADANCLGSASTRDLARWLGRPAGTIRVERHRARAKIKSALARAGLACPEPEGEQ